MPRSCVNAVVDTCVLLDMYSIHNLDEVKDQPRKYAERKLRARDALHLAMMFHQHRMLTYSLTNEPVNVLLPKAPPEERTSMRTIYVRTFVNFLSDYVLDGWRKVPDELETVTGNAADDFLVAKAKELDVPLISQERSRLPKKAVKAGVSFHTPRSFLAGFDTDEATHWFFERIRVGDREYFNRYKHLGVLSLGVLGRHRAYLKRVEALLRHILEMEGPPDGRRDLLGK